MDIGLAGSRLCIEATDTHAHSALALIYPNHAGEREGMSNYENKSAVIVLLVVDHIQQVGIRTAVTLK